MEPFEDIRKLIALKRYETPGDDYFERFYDEFKDRQRAEMMRVPAHRLLLERFDTWVSAWMSPRWAYAGMGAACALVLSLAILNFDRTAPEPELHAQVSTDVTPASLLREF